MSKFVDYIHKFKEMPHTVYEYYDSFREFMESDHFIPADEKRKMFEYLIGFDFFDSLFNYTSGEEFEEAVTSGLKEEHFFNFIHKVIERSDLPLVFTVVNIYDYEGIKGSDGLYILYFQGNPDYWLNEAINEGESLNLNDLNQLMEGGLL